MDELVELIKKKVFGQYITCKLLFHSTVVTSFLI